jgi:hypothetical protein
MKRLRTLVRDIEQNQARIAALRSDQVRIGEEIETLTQANKANVMTLIGNAVERLDFGSLATNDVLLLISKITESVGDRSAYAASSVAPGTIQTFVRLSRNASVSNRKTLDAAGLRWNGRSGGWTGTVSDAQLVELRQVFGKRVEKPEEGDEGVDLESPVNGVQRALSADVETIATLVGDEHGKAHEDPAPSTPDATLIPRSPFGGFPMRRSTT